MSDIITRCIMTIGAAAIAFCGVGIGVGSNEGTSSHYCDEWQAHDAYHYNVCVREGE